MINDVILKKNNNFVTKYGTTCKSLKPSVLYLRTKTKITPIVDKNTYENDIIDIKNKFTEYVDKRIKKSKYFDNNYIFNIDISSKSIKYGKTSFLRYDVYLKPIVRKSVNDNMKLYSEYSVAFDKKLIKLLNKIGLINK